MCFIHDAVPSTAWTETCPTARCEHICDECGRTISIGETYLRIKDLFDRRWASTAVCAHCRVGADWLRQECGGILLHAVGQEIHEHATEYGRQGLWRLVVGANRKWRRFDGNSLMPLPPMPPLTHSVPVDG
jgi:hypothetical protein